MIASTDSTDSGEAPFGAGFFFWPESVRAFGALEALVIIADCVRNADNQSEPTVTRLCEELDILTAELREREEMALKEHNAFRKKCATEGATNSADGILDRILFHRYRSEGEIFAADSARSRVRAVNGDARIISMILDEIAEIRRNGESEIELMRGVHKNLGMPTQTWAKQNESPAWTENGGPE